MVADDHSIAYKAKEMDALMSESGSRYDVVFNFADFEGSRIAMKNIGPGEPFRGDDDDFGAPRGGSLCRTDRIMAFNVILPMDDSVPMTLIRTKLHIRIEFPSRLKLYGWRFSRGLTRSAG